MIKVILSPHSLNAVYKQGFHGQHCLHSFFLTAVAKPQVSCCDANVVMGSFWPAIKYNAELRRKLSLDCFLDNTYDIAVSG
jgi:hypothetical protein